MGKTLIFKTNNVTLGKAIEIVKFYLNDPIIHPETKLISIMKVAEMATHNSITKDDLVGALRWMFERYDFPEDG